MSYGEIVVGIDGARLKGQPGWAVVRLAGLTCTLHYCASIDQVLAEHADAKVVAVDMPLGLVPQGWRSADRASKSYLGRRASCVFLTPPRPVLLASSHAEASAMSRSLSGQGLSKQAWDIAHKIRECDQHVANSRLFEVHPEVSFSRLAGEPLSESKKTWAGIERRRSLLQRSGIVVPWDSGLAGNLPPDDILDAAVAAWSAQRIAAGTAVPLPDPPVQFDSSRPIAIWS